MSNLAIRSPEDVLAYTKIVANPGSDAWKIMYGAGLGMDPVSACRSIHSIKGKPALSSHAWAGLIKRSGKYDYRIIEQTDTVCRLEFWQHGKMAGEASFTMEDARRAKLGGDNWQKYPSDMLFARALTRGARRYCPDLSMGGVYTPDELDDEPVGTGAEPPPVMEGGHAEPALPDGLVEDTSWSENDGKWQDMCQTAYARAHTTGTRDEMQSVVDEFLQNAGANRLGELTPAQRVECYQHMQGVLR
ncbi:MAG: hypothetical protein AAGB48_03110 [Planctomycetota bacterium]